MTQPLFQLTPEQRAELERQKSTHPADRRVHLELTEEQQLLRSEAALLEQAGQKENIAAYRRMLVAEREPTLSGDLRRAINASNCRPAELAKTLGITALQLDAFRCGDETLPSDVIDRLAAMLGMTLVPTSSDEARSRTTS